MCQFKSAVVTRTGELYHSPYSSSHEDIIEANNLKDGISNLVRIEYIPGEDIFNLDGYKLKVDEPKVPKWFDDIKDKITRKMRRIIARMIVTTDRQLLLGGEYLIKDCTIQQIKYCVVHLLCNATIGHVSGNATIKDVWGSATIKDVSGNATIKDVWGSATIKDVGGNATIEGVGGNATIVNVGDSATIVNVGDSATIVNVGDSATIKDVWGNATIRDVWGNATIRDDHRDKQ